MISWLKLLLCRCPLTELEKDAARYRYLRESYHFGGQEKYDLRWYLPRRFDGVDIRQQLDECIDSAIRHAKDVK